MINVKNVEIEILYNIINAVTPKKQPFKKKNLTDLKFFEWLCESY